MMIIEEFLNILLWSLFGENAPDNGVQIPEAQQPYGKGDPRNAEVCDNGHNSRRQNNGNVEIPKGNRTEEIQQPQNRGDENDAQPTGNQTNFSVIKAIWNNTLQPAVYWNGRTILLAFLIAVCGTGLLYLDFEMTDKCLSLLQFNVTVSPAVQRWELLGETVQALILNFWFVVTMMLLFGESMKQNLKYKLIFVSMGCALFQIVVEAHLIVFNVSNTPITEVFLVGVLFSCGLVGMAEGENRTNKWKIGVTIAAQFLLMFIIGLCHRFWVIPSFSSEENLTTKAVIALMAPVLAFFATSLSQFLVLAWSAPWLVDQKRLYVLVYFNQLLPLALFRVMQADFDDWGWFVGLSLIHNIIIFFSETTYEQRKTFWQNMMECLSKVWPRLTDRPQPFFEKSESKRLQTDLHIQYSLHQYTMIILSQIYITLYRYSTFDISFHGEISRMVGRIAGGLGIELLLNVLSMSLQIHFCGYKIEDVGYKCKLRHGLASFVLVMVTICYFSHVLYNVLKIPMGGALADYRVRNCSLPFTYE